MTKYSDEFKIKAVQMVLDGNTVKYVAEYWQYQTAVPYVTGSPTTNTAALTSSFIKNRSYSPDFKQKVLEHRIHRCAPF